jgi:hypothetical protein
MRTRRSLDLPGLLAVLTTCQVHGSRLSDPCPTTPSPKVGAPLARRRLHGRMPMDWSVIHVKRLYTLTSLPGSARAAAGTQPSPVAAGTEMAAGTEVAMATGVTATGAANRRTTRSTLTNPRATDGND